MKRLAARVLPLALAAMLGASLPSSAEERLTASGPLNHDITLREHAAWDRECQPVPHPVIHLDRAPAHGSVCARVARIEIQALFAGTVARCIGQAVRGVRLVYRPNVGYAGPDGLRYSVLYPRMRREVAVEVNVTGDSEARQAMPSPVMAPFGPSLVPPRQPAGPVPACADIVS